MFKNKNLTNLVLSNKNDIDGNDLFNAKTKNEIKFYLNFETNIDKRGYDGVTALIQASSNNYIKIVRFLIENKANINSTDIYGNNALIKASKEGNWEIVKFLIDKGADIHTKNKFGMDPFNWAIRKNNTNIIKILLDRKADVNTKNEKGNTPLMISSIYGYKEIVKTLIEGKADVNVKNNISGYTALNMASSNNHIGIMKFLIKNNADFSKGSLFGAKNLSYCAKNGDNENLKFLIDKGIGNVNKIPYVYLIPLIAASYNNNKETVQILLDNKAQINIRDVFKKTALFYAVSKGFKEIVELLINNKADTTIRDFTGENVLKIASDNGNKEIIDLLNIKN